ncbi:hypothetical protein [Planomonospora parontospora]|uniref:hypothetical protein n=1 Tax=Planomonospora parontospora TaxID=58119 RepID=UPI00167103B7|nr:hypothetical protein [Planomonospora parontospora]GGL56531.1 hypothetical protein GCM10014719_67470 [Planomonospora parontospora subsp. antibiotica]GII19937.1 hypothetical protein Ppa05_66630 [Planomonospora parontospora subsp. antibiotica]
MQDYLFSSAVRGLHEDLQEIAAGIGKTTEVREDLTDVSNGLADIKTEITDLTAAVRELTQVIATAQTRPRAAGRAQVIRAALVAPLMAVCLTAALVLAMAAAGVI